MRTPGGAEYGLLRNGITPGVAWIMAILCSGQRSHRIESDDRVHHSTGQEWPKDLRIGLAVVFHNEAD